MIVCKYCGSKNIKSFLGKNGKDRIYCAICPDCFFRNRNKIPHYITKEFIYKQHILLDKSLWIIAEENNLTFDKIHKCLLHFNIQEIIQCKHCGNKDNLLTRVFNNQFNKKTISTQRICKNCWNKIVGKTLKKSRNIETKEEKEKRSFNMKKNYNENPNRRINLGIKLKNVWKNKTNKEMEEFIQSLLLGHSKRTNESKTNQKLKRIETLIKNDSYAGNYCGMGNKAQEFFSVLHEFLIFLRIDFEKIHYGLFNKSEKALYVKDVSLHHRARFLDFYIKIKNKEYAIEFDEKQHKKIIKEDLLREWEIFQKRPTLIIIRIKEQSNIYISILEIIKIFQGNENLNYISLIDQFKNSFL